MKKTLVTMLAAAAVVASSYGQGTLTFTTLANQVTKDTAAGNSVQVNVGTGAANGQFEILWAPVGTTDLNSFTLIPGAIVTCSPTAGRLTGGARTIPAGSGFAGIAPGAVVSAVIRGWTGGAASYALAAADQAQAVGYSAIFSVDTGDPTSTPAGTPAAITGAGGFTGIQLHYTAVPEPTSMALAGLGAASLLIFRRRK